MCIKFSVELNCDKLQLLINQLHSKVDHMSKELDELKVQVTALETVEDSAIALLEGLKKRLDELLATSDIEGIKALSAEIGADTSKLADAVKANTPAA